MHDYYAHLIRYIIFPLSQRVRRLNYAEKLREARFNRSLNRQQIRDLQFRKLGAMIAHAYRHVPYYRDLFKQLGITPTDIQSWADFEALPVLTKAEVREYNRRFISEQPRAPLQKHVTSGTTGEPLTVLTSQIADAADFACTWRARGDWGVHIGDRSIHVRGDIEYLFKKSSNLWFKNRLEVLLQERLFNRWFIQLNDVSESKMEELLDMIKRFKPVFLSGYPSALYLLALKIKDSGLEGGSYGLKLIGCGGEVLHDNQKKTLQEAFNCPVANGYGAFELGIAANTFSCGELHTNDDFVIVEVIRSSPQYKFGAVVATPLDNWEFPLIRYAMGDLASLPPAGHECPGGIPFQVVEAISGRQFDVIRMHDGRLLHSNLFINLLESTPGVRQYQLCQESPSKFSVLFVPDPGSDLETVSANIKERIRTVLSDVEISVIPVSVIAPGPSGKYQPFLSKVTEIPQ